jgi:hypothetical protein
MEIPLGPGLTAFMKFLGLDLESVGKNLLRVKPAQNIASQKKKWVRWESGDAYPEKSSLPLIFVGLGFHRFDDFKVKWEEFKETEAGRTALWMEEKALRELLRSSQPSEVAEAGRPYAYAEKPRRRTVKGLVEQRFADRRNEISPGKAQAAAILWPQLLRNAEIVDDQSEIFEALCEEQEMRTVSSSSSSGDSAGTFEV